MKLLYLLNQVYNSQLLDEPVLNTDKYLIHSFMIILGLLSGGAMGLWHGCEYYEHEKIGRDALCDLPSNVQEGSLPSCPLDVFVKRWPGDGALLSKTTFKYDWSYIVSWIGVGMTLCSAILFFLAAVCIKNDKEREDAMNLQYLMPGKLCTYRDSDKWKYLNI